MVHDAAERRRLHSASGADAVDMESGVLARSGRLAGVVRAISDDVSSAIEGVDDTIHDDGRTDVLVHDATERERLRQASGADAVDMESGVLARSGRLAGVVRAISDDAGSTVAGVDTTVHADGRTNVAGLLRWVFARRGGAIRSMRDALRALHALEEAVAA